MRVLNLDAWHHGTRIATAARHAQFRCSSFWGGENITRISKASSLIHGLCATLHALVTTNFFFFFFFCSSRARRTLSSSPSRCRFNLTLFEDNLKWAKLQLPSCHWQQFR